MGERKLYNRQKISLRLKDYDGEWTEGEEAITAKDPNYRRKPNRHSEWPSWTDPRLRLSSTPSINESSRRIPSAQIRERGNMVDLEPLTPERTLSPPVVEGSSSILTEGSVLEFVGPRRKRAESARLMG
jgi:hypothetical protein